MGEHIHELVLQAAHRIASARKDWTFTPEEVVKALPDLNVSSVRTHVGSRCCVNAPKNHLHKWDYFRRVGRGKYEVLPRYRQASPSAGIRAASGGLGNGALRDTVHMIVTKDGETYVAECMELAVVTQAHSLDELLANIREALSLHLEDEDVAAFGLTEHPRMQLIYELPRAV